jgi:predicted phosphoribosyltransferase
MRFIDRVDAGRRLGDCVAGEGIGDVVVAHALQAPLDVMVVGKLGVPWAAREVAMGAIGEDGVRVVNDDVVRQAGVTGRDLTAVQRVELAELRRRVERLRGSRRRLSVAGRAVIVVDDGIATGAHRRYRLPGG